MTVENLEAAGMERMDAAQIDAFLTTQGVGVLGLSDGGVPYLLPMSFGYDDGTLYFTFLVDGESRKERLVETGDSAAFLVYDAATPFQWQSVGLGGTIEAVPPAEWDDTAGVMDNAWRPDIFENADAAEVRVYRFVVDERTGYKHTGLPAGFERGVGGE